MILITFGEDGYGSQKSQKSQPEYYGLKLIIMVLLLKKMQLLMKLNTILNIILSKSCVNRQIINYAY
jgi:hypothetical protein